MARFYGQFIQQDDLCFDIGAHVGNRVRAWRRLGARIVAVEPQPSCLRVLRYLYRDDAAVEIVPSAVGATTGRTILYESRATPALSTTDPGWVEEVRTGDRRFAPIRWDDRVDVDLVTLDDLVARHGEPTFCKIDVEGSESEVLNGLSRPLKALSFEFLPVSKPRAYACLDRLMTLGAYRFRWSEAETMRWTCPHWVDLDGIKEILSRHPSDGRSGDVYAILAS